MKPIKQIDIVPSSLCTKRESFLACLYGCGSFNSLSFVTVFLILKNRKNSIEAILLETRLAPFCILLKLLRLLAINLSERAVFAVDLSALYTLLEIVRCLDSICKEKYSSRNDINVAKSMRCSLGQCKGNVNKNW